MLTSKGESVAGNKEMVSYDLAEHRAEGGQKFTLVRHGFVPNMNGDNFIKQAYINAKASPEYAGAVDC